MKTASMYYLLLFSLSFLLILGTTPCSAHHVININSSTLQFSSLVWNPITQHFIAGSAMGPTVYAIPDEGTVKCLLSEPLSNSSGVSVTALAIDQIHLRLIVAFSNPSSVSAYDLKSYRKIYAVPLPELDGALDGVVVDLDNGEVFVSSSKSGVVLKVGFQGDSKKVISEFKIFGHKGLDGIVYLSHGYILVLQKTIEKIFKVDMIDGTMKDILLRDSSILVAQSVHAIVLQTEKSIVVATNQSLFLIKSDDNNWTRVASIQNKIKMKEEEMALAVTMRDRENVYVLVKLLQGYKIEEVVWREKSIKRYVLVFFYVALGGGFCISLIHLIMDTCKRIR